MKLKKILKYARFLLFGVFVSLVFIGGHSIGNKSERKILDACLGDLYNQCGITIEYALLLERENAKLSKDVELLTENLLECLRNVPMLPHIRDNNDDFQGDRYRLGRFRHWDGILSPPVKQVQRKAQETEPKYRYLYVKGVVLCL